MLIYVNLYNKIENLSKEDILLYIKNRANRILEYNKPYNVYISYYSKKMKKISYKNISKLEQYEAPVLFKSILYTNPIKFSHDLLYYNIDEFSEGFLDEFEEYISNTINDISYHYQVDIDENTISYRLVVRYGEHYLIDFKLYKNETSFDYFEVNLDLDENYDVQNYKTINMNVNDTFFKPYIRNYKLSRLLK